MPVMSLLQQVDKRTGRTVTVSMGVFHYFIPHAAESFTVNKNLSEMELKMYLKFLSVAMLFLVIICP